MGNRPRIAKQPTSFEKINRARQSVRELYMDMLGPVSNNECDMIVNARMDGLGDMFIAQLITKKREGYASFIIEREQLHTEWKQKSQAK